MAQSDNTRSTRGGCVSSSTTYQEKQLDSQSTRSIAWTTCSVSEQPLQPPIVADQLGHLYNKDALLEFLLSRKSVFADEDAKHRYANQLRTVGSSLDHIRSLKDVFTVHLTPNADCAATANRTAPAGAASSSAPGSSSGDTAAFMCPITMLPVGRYPFSALQPCGHMFSDRALANVSGPTSACPTCSTPFIHDDVIPINGTPEQIEQLRSKLKTHHSSKNNSKQKQLLGMAGKRKRDVTSNGDHEDKDDIQDSRKQPAPLLLLENTPHADKAVVSCNADAIVY
eukprot:jgi/Chrzof1/9209/Cz03g40010.t1